MGDNVTAMLTAATLSTTPMLTSDFLRHRQDVNALGGVISTVASIGTPCDKTMILDYVLYQ
jgi:hypothetical protein